MKSLKFILIESLKLIIPKPIKKLIKKYIETKNLQKIEKKKKLRLEYLAEEYPMLKSQAPDINLSNISELSLNLAVISSYCGTTSNATFNQIPIKSSYPHYFASNNDEVLALAVKANYIPIYLDLEISECPILSCYQAKALKIIPHTFNELEKYNYLFWRDDKISINLSRMHEFVRLVDKDNSSMALRSHDFLHGNVLFELTEAMDQERYRRQRHKYIAYVTEEVRKGYKLETQTYRCGAILRNMKHPDTIKINDLWWEHINRCGIEDQISFDFIAQRFDSITKLPQDLEYN